MAVNATLDSSNTNRRFILLAVVLGLLGAILVYVAFSRDSGSTGGVISGERSAVVVAKSDIPARTKVTADMLETKLVPADTVGELAFADQKLVIGQITRFPISMNQQLLSSQVIPADGGVTRALSYTIPKDKRAVAISASQIGNVGGLVLPGDYIDIMILVGNDETGVMVQTLMQNIEVLAVSQTVVDTVADAEVTNGQRSRNTEAKPQPDASTVSVLVTPEQAQTLFLADEVAELRMTLRSFGDSTEKPLEFQTLTDLLPGQ